MNIQGLSNIQFKGYDARPLRGFIMSSNCYGIAEEMQKIGFREGFKIFTFSGSNIQKKCIEGVPNYSLTTAGAWAQDFWTIVNKKLLALEVDSKTKALMDFFKLKQDFTQQIVRNNPQFQQLNEDLWTIFSTISNDNSEKISYKKKNRAKIIRDFEEKKIQLRELQKKAHIPGGNLFIIKNRGRDEVIVGEDALENYSLDEIKAMYNVDEITVLPQMDYHLDLFIRPLDNGRILLADDRLAIKVLEYGLKRFENFVSSFSEKDKDGYIDAFNKFRTSLAEFREMIKKNTNSDADSVAKILEEKGYEVVRVPARLYETCIDTDESIFLRHKCNYINSNVLINKDGDLVYIANKSNIDNIFGITPEIAKKIGFSFEKTFIESISPYIKSEHFYFVKGEDNFVAEKMLWQSAGGIHCTCSEVPE
jgi:hypothetical protein